MLVPTRHVPEKSQPDPSTAYRGGLAGVSSRAYATGLIVVAIALSSSTFRHPDPAQWTPNWLGHKGQITHPPNPSYEKEAFDPARVAYGRDGLALSVRRDPVKIAGTKYPYRSGAVTGYHKQAYVYGYFSARIFVPCSAGKIVNWPAFWLIGDPYKWPATGEIDVFEGLDGHAWWHFHYQNASGKEGSYGGKVAGNWCGWHTFAVSWRPAAIKWYYDGTKVATVTSGVTGDPMFPVFSYSLTDPSSAMCTRYPDACGGPIDIRAVMRVRRFTVRS